MASQSIISKGNVSQNPIISYSPLIFSVPGRQADMQIKITMPAHGNNLPLIVLSHGHGQSTFLSSLRGNAPLVDYYAAQGFVVIQPTHQDSKTLALDPKGLEGALFWRSRAEDMRYILDQLEEIEATVPGLNGRLDHSRIAAVGISLGGHTVGILLGMNVTNPEDAKVTVLSDSRIKAGVMMVPPGVGDDLAAFAREHYPILGGTGFTEMRTQALIVVGDKDVNPRFSERKDWRADAYFLSPSPKCLLTVYGAEHMLGGVSGYDAAETTDENPARVAFVQRLTCTYLRTALYSDNAEWEDVKNTLKEDSNAMGKIECK